MVKKRAVFGKRGLGGDKEPEAPAESMEEILGDVDAALPEGHLAAKRGDMELYEKLKKDGYDFNTPGPRGVTAAHVMASWDRHEMLEDAYNEGLINVNQHDNNGATPKNLAKEGSLAHKFLTSVTSEMQQDSLFVRGKPMENASRFTSDGGETPTTPRQTSKSDMKLS